MPVDEIPLDVWELARVALLDHHYEKALENVARAIMADRVARQQDTGAFVMVPCEPTEAMKKAGMFPFMAAHDPFFIHNEPCGPIYRAMLAAAPSPPDQGGGAPDPAAPTKGGAPRIYFAGNG